MTTTTHRHYSPLRCATLAFAISFLPVAHAQPSASLAAPNSAVQPTVEVIHFWVSQSEKKALNVYRQAWKSLGGKWNDLPTKDKQAELTIVSDRIANGYPPTVMQWFGNEGSQELPAMGVVQDIEEVATADHWREFLPKNVVDRISYKGRVYFAPTNLHAENWLWTSRKIFDQLKLPSPTSWDSLLDSAAKIKAAGYIPIARGSGTWETSLIFHDIIYSFYGAEAYVRLMSGSDPQAAMKPEMLKALGILRRLSAFVEPAKPGKTWADATLSVGRGRAGMQFMGDWAKGELTEAGLVADKDFRCTLAPGTESIYFVVVDAFAFPITSNANDRRSQLLFARQVMNTDNQLAFNRVKGSIPVRTDIQRNNLDACGKIGLDLISRKGGQVAVQSLTMPSQMSKGWTDVVADFLNDSKMTPESAQRQLTEVLMQK
ncbi:MAG: putative ABC transporter substrate-binding protein [Comamonadaceae bacterium]|nr:MAG: putative ABC transporter substrate-binding protein [Comamonadaceae bacterium]